MVSVFINRTKQDEQIDEIQENIATTLELTVLRMERKIKRSMGVIELNDGRPELIKRDLIGLLLDLEDIKNLASDLKQDARL